MDIKFNTCHQIAHAEDRLKESMYYNIHKLALKSRCAVILLSPLIAMASAIFTVATRIALIAEAIFKGLANILVCPFAKRCSFKRGVVQLLGSTTKHILLLPFSVAAAVISLFVIPSILIFDAKKGSERLWNHRFEKIEKRNHKNSELAEQKNNEAEYKKTLDQVGADTENVVNLLMLADLILKTNKKDRLTLAYNYYLRAAEQESYPAIKYCADASYHGKGAKKNKQHALYWYQQAYTINNEDIDVAKKCGEILKTGYKGTQPNFAAAIVYYERAAELGDMSSIIETAEMLCIGGYELEKDLARGLEWFINAAEQGNFYAALCLEQIATTFPDMTANYPELTIDGLVLLKGKNQHEDNSQENIIAKLKVGQFAARLANNAQ